MRAVVALKEGHGFSSEEAAKEDILGHCQRHLANYKIPRIVDFREELPMSAAGKVLRRVMRDEAAGSQQ